jgi:zinc transporter ZupT
MVAYILGTLYVVGMVASWYMVLTNLSKKNKDGDPEALDFLTSFAAGVFWPIFLPIYVVFLIMDS